MAYALLMALGVESKGRGLRGGERVLVGEVEGNRLGLGECSGGGIELIGALVEPRWDFGGFELLQGP